MIRTLLMAVSMAAALALTGCAGPRGPVNPTVAVASPPAYAVIVGRHRVAHGFNGVVLVGQGSQVLALVATGVADA